MRYPVLEALARRAGDRSILAFAKRAKVARAVLYAHAADRSLLMLRGTAERIAGAAGLPIEEVARVFNVEGLS